MFLLIFLNILTLHIFTFIHFKITLVMKKLSTQGMGNLSMLKIYAGAKNNYYAENMPGGGQEGQKPPKGEL